MEEPKLPGRSDSDGDILYQYAEAHRRQEVEHAWKKPFPRFRVKDTRDTVRNLIIAATVRDHMHDLPPFTGASYKQRKEQAVERTNSEIEAAGTLDWFKGLSEADFDKSFPHGPVAVGSLDPQGNVNTQGIARHVSIVDAFQRGNDLLYRYDANALEALRLDVLAALRAVFGDRPILTPKELMIHRDLEFRESDSLDVIRRLVVKNCRDCTSKVAVGLGQRLNDGVVFGRIARISGLDRGRK